MEVTGMSEIEKLVEELNGRPDEEVQITEDFLRDLNISASDLSRDSERDYKQYFHITNDRQSGLSSRQVVFAFSPRSAS